MDSIPRIVCVYKTGGDFSRKYVHILAQSVERHCDMRLACLSDDPGVSRFSDYFPIKNGWPKWWSKLELFEAFGHALYVDLDVIVKGDVRHMIDIPPDTFAMCRAFGKSGRANSSVMAWRGDYSHITKAFTACRIPEYSRRGGKWGDQDFIWDNLGCKPDLLQERHPGQIASRKRDTIFARRSCSLLCYHGKPRPRDTNWSQF